MRIRKEVKAKAGADLVECIDDAIRKALHEDCIVTLIHAGGTFEADAFEIRRAVKKLKGG